MGEIEDFYNPAMDSTIRSVIDAIIRQEGPVSLGLVAQRIVELWRIGRIGTRIRERIEQLAAQTRYEQTKSANTVFLWPKDINPHSFREFRVPGDPDKARRGPADIPVEEIANGALYILKGQISLPADDLMLETARLFGFQRTGTTVSECMGAGINHLVERGDALRQNGMVVYQES
jgi:hypothetical protein